MAIPNSPSNLIITKLQDGLQLNWTDNSNNETGFNVYKKELISQSLVPPMTGWNTPSPYVVSSTDTDTYQPAWSAFDGNDSTYWSASKYQDDITIKLDEAKIVDTYFIVTHNSSSNNNGFGEFYIKGSNDNKNWVNLYYYNDYWATYVTKSCPLNNNGVAYQYYKLDGISNVANGHVYIAEIELYGKVPTWVKIAENVTSTTTTDTFNYDLNKRYDYKVVAVNVDGESSGVENSIFIFEALNNITVNYIGYNVTLSWTAVDNVTGYKLYKNNVLFDTITTTTYNLTSTTEQNDEYYITAYNDVGESDRSDIITVTTMPNAPTNLTITQVSTGFKLDWSDNSNIETGYKIQKRISGGEWEDLVTLAANITTYTDEFTNTDGTLYEYQVCATNTQGSSAYTTWGITTVDSVTLSANLQDSLDKITYSWTENSTATGYKLHIGEQIIDVVGLTYDYTYTGEINVDAYVVAYITNDYDTFCSSDSNIINSISSPKTTVSNINYIISGSDITFTWDDNSTVESGFKLSYKIDSGAETIVDIPSTSSNTTGTQYSKTITVSNVLSNVLAKLAHYNNTGIGQYSSDITIITAPKIFQGKYDNINNLAKLGWINNNADNIILKYSINGGTEQTYTSNSTGNVLYDIPLASTSTLTATLTPILNGLNGFPSETLTIGDGLNVALEAPSQFDVRWDSDGIAEYTWTDNSSRETGYTFVYSINGGTEQEVDVTSISTLTAGNVYSAQITLTNHLDTVVGKVKAYSLVDESEFTNTVEQIYYLVDPIVPPNFIKIRTETGVRLQWDAVSYIDHYEITYILNETEYKIETANTYVDIDID